MLQRTDTINHKGKTTKIFSKPLEQYFDRGSRPNFNCFKPELVSRGYFANWLVESNRLYLVNFEGHILDNWTEKVISSIDLFGRCNNILAEWYTGEINIPYGNDDYPVPVKVVKLTFFEGNFIGEKIVG